MKACYSLMIALFASSVLAETMTFEAKGTSFDIEFVEVGAPGNPADFDARYPGEMKSLGAVDYIYSIAKYEASCEGPNLLFDRFDPCRPGYPKGASAEGIVEYVNWLNELQGYPHAYEFTPNANGSSRPLPVLVRNPQSRFFITTADEWHKAAYFDPVENVYYDYATGSDKRPLDASGTAPGTAVLGDFTNVSAVELAGGPSPFGTVGQTGNVHELEENLRWYRWGPEAPGLAEAYSARVDSIRLPGAVGFQLVSIPPVPEPTANLTAMLGLCTAFLFRQRRKHRTLA